VSFGRASGYGEQDFWFDLGETIEHTPVRKFRRTVGPNRSKAGRRQEGNQSFCPVRKIACNSIAALYPQFSERGSYLCNLIGQFLPGYNLSVARPSGFSAKEHCGLIIGALSFAAPEMKQVFNVIVGCAWKPARPDWISVTPHQTNAPPSSGPTKPLARQHMRQEKRAER